MRISRLAALSFAGAAATAAGLAAAVLGRAGQTRDSLIHCPCADIRCVNAGLCRVNATANLYASDPPVIRG